MSVSPSARKKSSTRASHRGSRSSKWPAWPWADHLLPGLPTNPSRDTARNISSSRAGVPRRRTQRLGYCSTGKLNSNFRSNQTGTWLIGRLDFDPFEIASFSVENLLLKLAFYGGYPKPPAGEYTEYRATEKS